MAIEVVFEKRINNVAISSGVDEEQRREHVLLVSLLGLFVVALMFYGWQQYRWIDAGIEIGIAQKERNELAEIQNQLIVERDSLARPDRIDLIARNRLGMTVAAPGQTVLDADAELGPPVVAKQDPSAATRQNPSSPLTAAQR